MQQDVAQRMVAVEELLMAADIKLLTCVDYSCGTDCGKSHPLAVHAGG